MLLHFRTPSRGPINHASDASATPNVLSLSRLNPNNRRLEFIVPAWTVAGSRSGELREPGSDGTVSVAAAAASAPQVTQRAKRHRQNNVLARQKCLHNAVESRLELRRCPA